jgi:DNA-binding PadR family transcriptional regulator
LVDTDHAVAPKGQKHMHDSPADQWFRGVWDPVRIREAIETRARMFHAARGSASGGHGRHRDRGSPATGPELPPAFAFGPLSWGGPGGIFGRFPFGRGPKARRGDVRAAALLLLGESPRNGYQLMQEIESRSGGVWRPSPGSIYPVLQQLEDEGLVRPEGADGRRVYQLTEEGRKYIAENADELGTPWETVADSVGGNVMDYRSLIVQVHHAAVQVMRAGNQRQVKQAMDVLSDCRRRLYRILAEDGDAGDDGAAQSVDDEE